MTNRRQKHHGHEIQSLLRQAPQNQLASRSTQPRQPALPRCRACICGNVKFNGRGKADDGCASFGDGEMNFVHRDSSFPLPQDVTHIKAAKIDKKARQGSGAPSFCWICGKQLMRAPGKGKGLFFFDIVIGRGDDEQHRVHRTQCLRVALDDGNKYLPQEQSK